MPRRNNFRHQSYDGEPSPGAFTTVSAGTPIAAGQPEAVARLQQVAARLRQQQVDCIVLVHGTFVGQDAAGLCHELARVFPAAADSLRSFTKCWVDRLTGEHGNFTESYRRLLEQGLNPQGAEPISVRLFHWSGENHHLGRADGAIRLIDLLDGMPARRVLLWGHSHAGNVFALMTNLLGADPEARDRFFRAAVPFFDSWWNAADHPVWMRIRERLSRGAVSLPPLDIVTCGTPVRYGWDSAAYRNLLHFVHHRPTPGLPEHRAKFPFTVEDVAHAVNGDCIQQLGIAGTNFLPNLLAWKSLSADRLLNRLLQPGMGVRDLPERLRLGCRVPDEGHTLLVDYGPCEGGVAEHHGGHAVYTERQWIVFHAETIAEHLL